MGHLTRCYVAVMLVCEIVSALDDPYIHLTKRLNNIERNVNANFEILRTEMTMLFDVINRINFSVFEMKEMFLNKRKNDPHAKHTEFDYVNAIKGSSDRLPSSELALQMHLMSKGLKAEKKARVQLRNDMNWILLSLQEHNSSVDAKLLITERNLTDVVRTIVALNEENRISLTKMQEKLESKQNYVEDKVRELIEDAAYKKRTCSPMFEKHGNSCYLAVSIEATWLNAKITN
ncbi:hypothetical protein CHS0354_026033 [Potamilus streckersoni]|uniref:Uncharacterized protein n=1 Tax=Potamilus streckersoni TaxID=2493646 RepID=A0AAE0SBA6_9BIVA|nr:hypothetical protein CHS0354_026033 [Potamilus streckersoni]